MQNWGLYFVLETCLLTCRCVLLYSLSSLPSWLFPPPSRVRTHTRVCVAVCVWLFQIPLTGRIHANRMVGVFPPLVTSSLTLCVDRGPNTRRATSFPNTGKWPKDSEQQLKVLNEMTAGWKSLVFGKSGPELCWIPTSDLFWRIKLLHSAAIFARPTAVFISLFDTPTRIDSVGRALTFDPRPGRC